MPLIINAILLYILVSIFGDNSETSVRWKVLAIAVLVAIGEAAGAAALPGLWWLLGILVLSAVAVAVALQLWCKIARAAAIKIAALFMGVRIALQIVLMLIFSPA